MASSITPLGLALLPNSQNTQGSAGLFTQQNVWNPSEADRRLTQSDETIDWAHVLAPSVPDTVARQTIADHIKLFAAPNVSQTSKSNFGPLSLGNNGSNSFGDLLVPPSSGSSDQPLRAFGGAPLLPHSPATGQLSGLPQGPRPGMPSLLQPLPSGSSLLSMPPGSMFAPTGPPGGGMYGGGAGIGLGHGTTQGYGQLAGGLQQGPGLLSPSNASTTSGAGAPPGLAQGQGQGQGQGSRGLSPQEAAAVLAMVQELDRQLNIAKAQAAVVPALQNSLTAATAEVSDLRAKLAKEQEAAQAQAKAQEQQVATLREEAAAAAKSTASNELQTQVQQLRERLQEAARRAKVWQEEKGELEAAVAAAHKSAAEAKEEAGKERRAAAELQNVVSGLQSEQERLLASLKSAREEAREASRSGKEAASRLEKELKKATEGTKKSDAAEREKAAALKATVEKLSVQVELLADAVKSRDADVTRLTTSVSNSTKQLAVVQMALDKVQKERDALREELISTQDLLSETRKSASKGKDAEAAARSAMAGWRHKFVQVGQELARAREQHARDKTAWEVIFEAMRLSLLDEVEGKGGSGRGGEGEGQGEREQDMPISPSLYRQQLHRIMATPGQAEGTGESNSSPAEAEELLPTEPSPLDEVLSARAKAFKAAATAVQENSATQSVRQVAVSQARQLLAASRDVLLDRTATGRDFLARLGFVSDGSGSGALTFVGLEGQSGREEEGAGVQEGDLAPLSLPASHAGMSGTDGHGPDQVEGERDREGEGDGRGRGTSTITPSSALVATAPLLSAGSSSKLRTLSRSKSGGSEGGGLGKLEDDYFDDPLRVPFVSISYLNADDESCLKRLQSIVKLGCPVDRSRDVKTLLYCVASGKMRCVSYLMEQGVRHGDNDAAMRVAALAVRYAIESWSNIDSKKAKEEMSWRLAAGVSLISKGCPLLVPEDARRVGEHGQALDKIDDPVYRYDPDRTRYGPADLWASVPVILGVKEYAADWKEAAPPVTGKGGSGSASGGGGGSPTAAQDTAVAVLPPATAGGGRRFTTFRVAAKAKIVAEIWGAWEKEWSRVQGHGQAPGKGKK